MNGENLEAFKQSYHGRMLVALRDKLCACPESADRDESIQLLKEIFLCSYALWMLHDKKEPYDKPKNVS